MSEHPRHRVWTARAEGAEVDLVHGGDGRTGFWAVPDRIWCLSLTEAQALHESLSRAIQAAQAELASSEPSA